MSVFGKYDSKRVGFSSKVREGAWGERRQKRLWRGEAREKKEVNWGSGVSAETSACSTAQGSLLASRQGSDFTDVVYSATLLQVG